MKAIQQNQKTGRGDFGYGHWMKATGTGISFAAGGALLGGSTTGAAGALAGTLILGILGLIIGVLTINHASR